MELSKANELYGTLAGDRLCFLYSGAFHDGHTARLIALGEEASLGLDGGRSLSSRLAFVMVEAYQNIIRHRPELTPELALGAARSLFMLRDQGSGPEVITVNPVEEPESETLSGAMDRLTALDMPALKELFLHSLKSGQRTRQGGAGLGLIEIARRSTQGVRHHLEPLDELHRLFTLQVQLAGSAGAYTSLPTLHHLRALVVEQDILLLYKGVLSPGVQASIIRMVGSDLDERGRGHDARPRAFHSLMELVQELGALERSVMVLFAQHDQGDRMLLALPLENAQMQSLDGMLRQLQGTGPQLAYEQYRKVLLGRLPSAGPGHSSLLDLAAHCVLPLQYELQPTTSGGLLLLGAVV